MATRKDRQRITLKAVIAKCNGRDAFLGWLLGELDNPRCQGAQRERYQKTFDKLIGEKVLADKELNEKPVEEVDPFA